MQLGLYGPLSLIEGHKSAGVAAACDRVVELSGTVAATDEILETLHGLYSNAIAVGSLDRSHLVATKHAKVSEELGDRASIMDDHLIAGVDAFLHGDEPRAKNRFVKVAEHYISPLYLFVQPKRIFQE